MIEYFKIYDEVVGSIGDKVAFSDGVSHMTYRQLDDVSAKIYHHLKKKGIGRESFVQLFLPRGIKIPAAVMGVVKAGAAFVVIEDTYPADRTEFIYDDMGCVLRIDDALYDEIEKCEEPLSGREVVDPHDACYAVYTSGSTGNPKGVLHEYGNIEQNYKSFETWYDKDISNAAIFAPFYFVAGVIDIFHYITRGRTTYIIPHDMTRDFVAVKKFIVDRDIQEIFLPPSYLRIYTEPAESLKVLYTGSEPANGLSYGGKPTLINFYAMSESGFVVLQSELDHPYDVAPVGRSLLDEIQVRIIDEDGKTVEGAGQGELCFVNEYVRGYIGLEEQTKAAWKEDGLFHTNDCVRRDEDGRFYVVGRYDDMIKINGNRVEPVEIETKIKSVTGLEQVVAKGFKENERTFICAYYLEDEAESKGIFSDGELKIDEEKLKSLLPDYMIPTYYVPLRAFPLLPNGKVAKKNLQPPSVDDFKREYIEPTTELEKKICDLYKSVLKLDRVGITDDFYEMGGDSMSSIILAAKLVESGLPIQTKAIYDCRTPEKIADYYEKNKDVLSKVPTTYDNSKAFLTPNYSGKAFLKATKDGEGGVFTYHMTFRVDADALALAYERMIEKYPFFALSYEEKDELPYYCDSERTPVVKPWSEYEKKDPAGSPLIEVYYDDDKIIIYYYHLLTDGEGVLFFASGLLSEYISVTKGSTEEQVARQFDYTYDVLAERIDTAGEYKMYELPDTFTPPELDLDNKRYKMTKLTLKRKDWLSVVNEFKSETGLTDIDRLQGIGGADAFVAGYLFMRTFAEVNPDADKPLMCRFPINMRYSLNRENTLRNCALPQAFYNINASDILKPEEGMKPAFERINAQLSTENVEHEVNRLVDFMMDENLDIGDDPVYNYIRYATVLATNLGNIASVAEAKYVRDFSISFRPTCYTSIQACVKGDEEVLIINQVFDDDVYINRLIYDLESEYRVKIECV